MKRKPEAAPKIRTLGERFVDHREGEIDVLRKRVDYLEGKCDRLELSISEFKSEPAQVYVQRTDQAARPKITEVPVKRPLEKKDFSAIKSQWNDMSQEEQEKAVEQGFEVMS